MDDEIHAIKVLTKHIDRTPGLHLIGSETNPLTAWSTISAGIIKPDLVFLDIDMPQLSGIELADLLKPVPVIFTTAHPDYALEAFEKNAIDYLLKPFSYERFLKALTKINERLSITHQTVVADDEKDFYIKSETKGKMIKVKYEDILYIEAKANYLKFYLGNKSHLAYLTLKELDEKLPSKIFLRVHKSYIVNLTKIIALDSAHILLENKDMVEIGRSYKSNLLEVINPKLISSKRFT